MHIKHFSAQLFLLLFALVALLFTASAPAFAAAKIVIVNVNEADEGFNDPTPAAPVGGNPGTTVGQQRLIAFQFAADIWGATLDSNVEIRVQASFEPLTCTATTAVLGSAGAISVFSGFPGTEFANTWYAPALANKRAGFDLRPGPPGTNADDIRARFNSSYGGINPDESPCATNSSWYYGLDTNQRPNQVNLVVVLLHEFGHGLGFFSLVDEETGEKFFDQDDVYSKYLFDTSIGKLWDEMTNAERQASAVNSRRVVWDGANVSATVPAVLSPGTPLLVANSPAAVAGTYDVGGASFGPPLASSNLAGNVVLANDEVGATADACSPLANAEAISGSIALVDRGTCNFTVKVKNAQDAGAVGVIVADNVPGGPPPDLGGGPDPTITIPAVRITLAVGDIIKAALASDAVNVAVTVDQSVLSGADASGRALLNAPDPVQPGSSISHWDPIASRNLLMEPAINDDLSISVKDPEDLTLALMRDIGWFADADEDGLPDGVDISPARFATTATITRDCETDEYVAEITLTNTGPTTTNNVQITSATLGGVRSTSQRQLYGTLKPGDSATRTLRFPSTAGSPEARAVLLLGGTETTTFIGGSFSTGTSKVLPACNP